MPAGPIPDTTADGLAVRADARLRGAIADVFLADDARLDERTRLAVGRSLAGVVDTIEADVRRQAARLLAGRGHADAAAALLADEGVALARLTDAGLLRDTVLMDEVIARARVDLIGEALPGMADAGDGPSFLVRLADQPDSVVAGAARALLAASSRQGTAGGGLPAEVHDRLVWWIAAAVRAGTPGEAERDAAIGEAARRCVGARDEAERADTAAMRLAVALDPLPGEWPILLVEAIGDRRLTLFVALLARALGIEAEVARALVLDVDDDRLWLALASLGLSREQIARIGLSLADADPRRDVDAFADRLDALVATPAGNALTALHPLKLPRDFRAAIVAVARS